jgi:hypothetical protein
MCFVVLGLKIEMLIRLEITVPKYLAPKEILKKIQVTTRPDNVQ